jgi:hypothetical protein
MAMAEVFFEWCMGPKPKNGDAIDLNEWLEHCYGTLRMRSGKLLVFEPKESA